LSIAAGGEFYNVQPGTAAWFYFVEKIRTLLGFIRLPKPLLIVI